MIERHITFNVHPDRAGDFERFVATEYAPAMARSDGFVSVGLLRELEKRSRYQMVLRFRDVDAATGWRTSPEHQALQPGLETLHSGMDIVAYEVVG
jgi:antibiotic biosynthesis monooxygenase (ABM) superfamily enzyme